MPIKPENPSDVDVKEGQCPFHPPMPDHRKHNISFFKKLIMGHKMDMLGNYTEKGYNYMMGKNNMGVSTVYAINCLDSARRVLISEANDFHKSDVLFRSLEPLIGHSLLTVSGDEWKGLRKKLGPALQFLNIKRCYDTMSGAVNSMIERFDAAVETGEAIDLDREMSLVTADVMFRAMCSNTLDGKRGSAIYHNFNLYQKEQRYFSLRTLINWPKWVPFLGKRQNKKALAAAASIRAEIKDLIDQRIKMPEGERPVDILSSVLEEYEKEFGQDLPLTPIIDHIATFYLAGHETSAASVTWASYLLANSPADEQRMLVEIDELVGQGSIEFSDVKKLKFVEAVFNESMRLYAPVPYFARQSLSPKDIRGHQLQEGSQCTVNAYFIHRHQRLWENPDDFIPDRFMDTSRNPDDKLSFMPFAMGPRSCPGANFATVESILLLASIFRRYKLTMVEGQEIKPFAQLTMRPKNGILFTLEKR